MRVAIVHSFYSNAVPSGENVVVRAQVEALREAGHEVLLVSRSTDDLSSTRSYAARAAMTVASGAGPSPVAQLTEFDPDVVHVHNLFPNWGVRWLRGWRGPVVTTLHNYRTVCSAGTLFRAGQPCRECVEHTSLRAVRHRCYRDSAVATIPLALSTAAGPTRHPLLTRSNAIIALSDFAAHELRRAGVRRPLQVLPNFVARPAVDASMAAPQDRWLYIGRISAEKGILDLARHWPDSHRLEVYGSGPCADQLEALTSSTVRFHGLLDHSAVASALADSRGLVFPSLWTEGSPMIYAEALSVGRPVVAHTQNMVGMDVAEHRTGAVFDDFGQLRAVLEQAEHDWSAMSTRAEQRYEEAFGRPAWVAEVERIYSAAIRSAGRS